MAGIDASAATQAASPAVAAPVSGKASVPGGPRATRRRRGFWRQGEPWVWASAAALAAMLMMVGTLLAVIAVGGLGVFWPSPVLQVALADGTELLGRRIRSEVNPDNGVRSVQFKTANREFDPARQAFRWIAEPEVRATARPADAVVLERLENGDFYGFLREIHATTLDVPADGDLSARLTSALVEVRHRREREVEPIAAELFALSDRLQEIRDRVMRIRYQQKRGLSGEAAEHTLRALGEEEAAVKQESQQLVERQHAIEADLARNVAVLADGQGHQRLVPLTNIVRCYYPNAMSLPAKAGHYLAKVWELVSDAPRESNTEGGLWPAIFGTVMLMFLMATSGFPLGVLAGVYLGEYAHDGPLVRVVRVAVNNLAGIPSIVFGIFGLGFFV